MRVLVVDDNEVNREILAELFEMENCQVYTAKDGQEAVELAQSMYFPLVLMDIMMPVMDGIEATQKIRAMQQAGNDQSLIVAITAMSSDYFSRNYREEGFDQYYQKPFNADDIEYILRDLPDYSI